MPRDVRAAGPHRKLEVADMRRATQWLAAMFIVGFLLTGLATPTLASPPSNDDFANADVVPTLPFSDSGDLAATTPEAGEPWNPCIQASFGTAWYVFTPADTGSLRIDLTGSDWLVNVVAYQSSGTGLAGLGFLGCGGGLQGPAPAISVTAGSTYYVQVGANTDGPAHLELGIEMVAPPANDDFAEAEALSGAPVTAAADLTAATIEPGEPAPGGQPVTVSAWYAYTPAETGTHLVRVDPSSGMQLGVYTGTSLADLSEIASGPGYYQPVTFTAQAGTRYYVQAAATGVSQWNPVVRFTIERPAPPAAHFWYHPSFFGPSVHDTVQFSDLSYDPASVGFGPAQWDFGDGATATGPFPTHRYAADGDYTVTLTVTTHDGRTATATQVLTVSTHDVSIERIQAPNSAGVGQTRNVTVKVRGGKYVETVQVNLYRSRPGGPEELVGTTSGQVPQAHGGRTTGFDFSYTFTPDDGASGKVTFRAEAAIVGARDSVPGDNQAIAPPTGVKR